MSSLSNLDSTAHLHQAPLLQRLVFLLIQLHETETTVLSDIYQSGTGQLCFLI